MPPPAVIVFRLLNKMPPKSLQPTYIIPGTGHDFCLMCDLLSTVIIRLVSSLHVFDSTDLASSIEYFVKEKEKRLGAKRIGFPLPFPRRY